MTFRRMLTPHILSSTCYRVFFVRGNFQFRSKLTPEARPSNLRSKLTPISCSLGYLVAKTTKTESYGRKN